MRGYVTHLIALRREKDELGMICRFGWRRRKYRCIEIGRGLSYWELV